MADPAPEEEIVTDVSEGGARTIRVYDSRGDFTIEVPEGAKVTFGYFNPVAPRELGGRDFVHTPDNVARQTALRIYERGEKGNQLACFLGVKGFRDLSISLTRLAQRVVIETNELNDEVEGVREWGGKAVRQLIAAPEEGTFQ